MRTARTLEEFREFIKGVNIVYAFSVGCMLKTRLMPDTPPSCQLRSTSKDRTPNTVRAHGQNFEIRPGVLEKW